MVIIPEYFMIDERRSRILVHDRMKEGLGIRYIQESGKVPQQKSN